MFSNTPFCKGYVSRFMPTTVNCPYNRHLPSHTGALHTRYDTGNVLTETRHPQVHSLQGQTLPRDPSANNSFSVYTGGVSSTRHRGDQTLSTCATALPHARIYKTTALHKHKTIFAPTTANTPGPDLPPITCIEHWARLLLTHTHEAFATVANLHGNHTCPPVTANSSAALITPYIV
jgi:hypothetical protein